MRTLGRLFAVLAIALSGLALHTPSAQAAGSTKCYYSGTAADCYQVLSTAQSSFAILFSDALINTTGRPASLTCTVSETKTISTTATISVSGEVKAFLVASMKTEASASIQESATATRGSSTSVAVPARTTTLCDRGTYKYVATVRHTGSRGQTQIPTETFTVTAPSTVVWRFRDQ